MMKLAMGLMGGVFLGALFLEILRHKNPAMAEELERRAKEIVRASLRSSRS